MADRNNSVRRIGSCHDARSPSTISRPMCGAALGIGRGSGVRMSHTEIAEQTKDAASNRMAIGAVMAATRMPVSPGPTTPAMDSDKVILLLPSRMFSALTSDGR
ncbi:MAG: hypothetical protein ABSF54_12200 [Bryobacteraceae bacterium]